MKLVIITAISEFEKEVKKILKESKVLSYSYREVKGYRDSTEEAVETNWFAAEMNETQSVLFYALVSKENVSLLLNLTNEFNEKQEAKSHIHIAVLNVEQTN